MKTINYSKNVALVAAATLFVTAFAVGVQAGEVDGAAPARAVRYSDVNLNTQVGAEVLYERIRNAAELVCGDVNSHRSTEAAAAKSCVNRAVMDGVKAVNNRQLTSAYVQHGGVAQTTVSVASLR